ncbi:hypothetical protein C8J56DRAFT_1159592 [Mycena floridula]|nr:hypothetical protein C8J56DRAFT_1159592 [Mycena floridula]
MSDPPNLSTLPLDLLIHIQSFVEPKDILSLRKVCHSISESTKKPTVWIVALENLCSRFNVFAPSFPIQQLSVQELEYLSTSEYRFTTRLRTQLTSEHDLRPTCARLLNLFSENYHDCDVGIFDDAYLIPGGRYLLTITTTSMLQLWDLGYTPNSIIPMVPSASLLVEKWVAWKTIRTQPSNDGYGLDIIVPLARSDDDPCLKYDVYRIFPLSQTASFNRIATLSYESTRMSHFFCSPGLIALGGSGGLVVVWDYLEDKWIQWKLPASTGHVASEIVIVDDNIMVITSSCDALIFSLPELKPRISGETTAVTISQHPLLRLKIGGIDYNGDCNVQNDASWAGSSWGCSAINDIDDPTLTHYVLRKIPKMTSDSDTLPLLPSFLPIQTAPSETHNIWNMDHVKASFGWDDYRLLCYVNCGKVFARLSDLRRRNSTSETFGVLQTINEDEDEDEDDGEPPATRLTLCPVSGRMILWEGHQIQVLDYVSWPSQGRMDEPVKFQVA